MRRISTAIITLLALLIATTIFAVAPSSASAAAPPACHTAAANPRYQGWATFSLRGCPIPGSNAQTADCKFATAWRWGGAWSAEYVSECGASSSSLRPGRVYLYPYASGWSWVWTARSGWLAIQSRYVLINA